MPEGQGVLRVNHLPQIPVQVVRVEPRPYDCEPGVDVLGAGFNGEVEPLFDLLPLDGGGGVLLGDYVVADRPVSSVTEDGLRAGTENCDRGFLRAAGSFLDRHAPER